jgi:hypothetical protein
VGGLKALSLKQPWAYLMVNGWKTIENRNWSTSFRGPVLVHASLNWDNEAFPLNYPKPNRGEIVKGYFYRPDFVPVEVNRVMPQHVNDYQKGGIVGMFTITDCVDQSDDPWFFGRYGFVVRDPRPLPFVPLRGHLNFFDVPDDVIRHLKLEVAAK